MLAGEEARYVPVSEYVSPSAVVGRRPAGEFFDFEAETGEMLPSSQLDGAEWSMARRRYGTLT